MSTFSPPSAQTIRTTASFPQTSPSSLLALLHLPELLIQLNPLVHSFDIISPPGLTTASSSSPSQVEYNVTDLVPILGGLWSTKTAYTARFTPNPESMLVEIQAAMGITSRSVWSVEQVEGTDGSEVMEESEVSIAGGRVWDWMLRGYVEGQIRASHGLLMERLRDKVNEMGR